MPTLAASRWVVHPYDPEAVSLLQAELGVDRIVAASLVSRGMSSPEIAHKFLNPSLADLNDPTLLPDYHAAVKAILGAKERGEKVYVHGDYDVDGVTSAAILTRFLRSLDFDIEVRVPHRMKHGYGVHEDAVQDAHRNGAKLLLTCDCGVGAHASIQMAHELGIKTVVTDHHTVGETLPEHAEAIVNPHRADSKYPFADLCGAGVAFKLCEGITRELGHNVQHFYRAFLDLVALGTVSDIMPLVDENRTLVHFGLKQLGQTKKPGLIALKQVSKIDGEVTSYDAGWRLGPRLNAAGRIEDAALSLRILLTQDTVEANQLARQLDDINLERREEEKRIVAEAAERVEQEGLHERPVIFLTGNNWHLGIVGLVAGRLVERFRRPAFVLNIDEEAGIAKGSGRSIEGFDLSHVIHTNPDQFASGGGHAMAAGCSVKLDKLEEVRAMFEAYAQQTLKPEDYIKVRRADAEIYANELNLNTVEDLAMFEPCGAANSLPVFVARGLKVHKIKPLSKPEHVHVYARWEDGAPFKLNGWRMAEAFKDVQEGATMDILFKPGKNEFNGSTTVDWNLEDCTFQ